MRETLRPSTVGAEDVIVQPAGSDLGAATRRIIEMLGGMNTVLAGREVALLKPNFVAGRPARSGATTNFQVIAAVAETVREAGAVPMLYESPGMEFDLETTYSILGLEQFCREHQIEIVSHVDRWLEVRPTGARRLKRFRVPAQVADACLINLPVLKTHVVSGMSLAMKNVMGLLPREDRRTMHTLGIQQCIVDLNRGIKPDLSIVDGSVGQDGEGPLYGEAANLGALVAGFDSLAVDLACCQLVQVDPMQIGHLRLGMVQLGARRSRLHGQVPEIAPFRLPHVPRLYRFAFWLMYPLDYPYHRLTGQHLCAALYRTGLVGTRPEIVAETCTECGICVETCPIPHTIDLASFRINPRTCARCLLCYEACPENAISVRGMSGAASPAE